MTAPASPESIFYVYNEADFEDFLQLNYSFVRTTKYVPASDAPADVFKANLYTIVKKFRSRRMFSVTDLAPFYADNDFIWVFSVRGESPEQVITSAAIVKRPKFFAQQGEVIYLDTDGPEDVPALMRLYKAASTIAKTWEHGVVPLNMVAWRDNLNKNFLDYLENESFLKTDHSGTR